MIRLAGSLALVLCVSVLPGCDSGKKDAKDDKAAADKSAPAGKEGGDAKADAEAEAKATQAEATPAAPVKLAAISLEDVGLDAELQAPEGAKASEDFGSFVVQAGESFQLQISPAAADLAARKQEIEGNTVNKLERFVTESATELVYESKVASSSEFHFVANVEVDGAKYNCEDKKGQAFTQADIDAMLAACKSLKGV